MKNLIKPASLLFYFFSVIVFFFIGIYVAKLVGAGKNQMLAGGAIVLFYGVVVAGIAFILSLFIASKVKLSIVIKINKILGILFLLLVCFTAYKFITREKTEEPVKEYPKKTTAPAANEISMLNSMEYLNPTLRQQNIETNMGIGFFKPNYFEYPTLYFYGGINLEKSLQQHIPLDSVGFGIDKYSNPTTTYAPPWLYPEHLKLDYGIFIFKVLGIGQDFVKVEGNKRTKQITYLDKSKGEFLTWHSFLLTISSVEFLDNAQHVRVKPLEIADEVNVNFSFMRPLLIEADWMYVILVNDDFVEQGKGWIRWKKDNVLQITYSLLS